MANWWEELQKNNSQQSMSLSDYGKTFKKEAAVLAPSGEQAQPTSRAAATSKAMSLGQVNATPEPQNVLELFSTPFRIGSEMSTAGGIVAQAVLRNPSRYLGNIDSYKNLWKSAYRASVGDRTNKEWWQGGEDPVTIGQMYNSLFNADAPDLLDKNAVNQYYETGDLFDKYGMPTPRFQSGSLDVLAMIFLDPMNAVGAGGLSKAEKAAEALSAGAKAVEHLTLRESIEGGLRGSTGAGLAPDTERASRTALADMLREESTGPLTSTTNPLRRERIRNEISRFVSEVDFYDKAGLLDQSGNLLKYGDEDYLTAARIFNEVFAPIEDVKFPDPSIFGIKDLLSERDFRYFVLDAETFATDGTSIMRWSYEKEKWMPALTFPKISVAKVMQSRMSLADNISNQIKSYDVGAEKTAVSPHVKEMILSNLTDGPFGATETGLLPPSTATEAYKVPDSAFNIPAVDSTGVKVPQPISAGARFSHVVIDGRKVYVLYDNQYDRFYTLQSYRTAKSIDTGIEPYKFEDVNDATITETNVGETIEGNIIDDKPGAYDTDLGVSEDELADFGKDNLFTVEDAPRGARVIGAENKQRLSANRKLVWVRADWFDLARVESYEFKFVDGVTRRTRKVQVPSKFKLVNASEVSKGARPIFVEYIKKPGQFVPNPTQYTVNRAGEIVPAAKAIAEDVAFKNETAAAAKLQADLQASITAKMSDPAYINEMRRLHSSEYLTEEPRQPIDYNIWYDYKVNPDGTINVTAMARRTEMSGFDDWAEVVSTKDFALHTWENIPEQVIKRYTYEGYGMYGNRGGTVSPLDQKVDQTGKTLWERTIGNAEEPAVSFNVDDIYRFGYSRPYESRVAKPTVKEGESLTEARLAAFEKEKTAIVTKRNSAIKQLEYIQKQYPDWEQALAEATRLETRWREISKELEVLKSKELQMGKSSEYNKNKELITKLEEEQQSIEQTLTSTEHTALLNSAKVKYAMRAKSIRLYLKHLDEIAPYYVDTNYYILGYSKGIINRNSDIKRTEQWLLNFEDFLNNSLGTKFSAQKSLEDLAAKEEVIVPQYYIPEGRAEEFVIDAKTKRIADEAVARGEGKPLVKQKPARASYNYVQGLIDEYINSVPSGNSLIQRSATSYPASEELAKIFKQRKESVIEDLKTSGMSDEDIVTLNNEIKNYSDEGTINNVLSRESSSLIQQYNIAYAKRYLGLEPDDTIKLYRSISSESSISNGTAYVGYATFSPRMALNFSLTSPSRPLMSFDIKIKDLHQPFDSSGFGDEFAMGVKKDTPIENVKIYTTEQTQKLISRLDSERHFYTYIDETVTPPKRITLSQRQSPEFRFEFPKVTTQRPKNIEGLSEEDLSRVTNAANYLTQIKFEGKPALKSVINDVDGTVTLQLTTTFYNTRYTSKMLEAVAVLQDTLGIQLMKPIEGRALFDFEKKILNSKDS